MTKTKTELLEELANFHKINSVDSGMSEQTAMYYGVLYGWEARDKLVEAEIAELKAANQDLRNASRIDANGKAHADEYIQKLKFELDNQMKSTGYKMLEAEIAELKAKHAETLSYLPKVPTEPYEKELAKKCAQQSELIEKMAMALEHYEVIPYIKVDGVDSMGEEIENEYFVAAEALAEYEKFKGEK